MNSLLLGFSLTTQTGLLAAANAADPGFDTIAGVVLGWIGQALIYGSLLAVVTWLLLSTAFRKARPAIHAGFWLIVIAKFLLPIGPGWNYSLASLTSSIAPWLGAVNATAPSPEPASKQSTIGTFILYFVPTIAQNPAPLATAAQQPLAAPAARPWSAATMIAGAYLLGLALVLAIRLQRYTWFAQMTRRLPLASAEVVELVAQTARHLRIRRLPTVRISDAAIAPYVIGAIRPTLVLSTENLRRTEECEAVILHELAHLRRHDLLVRYAQWLAGTLLYFWPVVAWVNRRIDLAREAACDEWALRHGRLSPAEYARCLLKHMRPRRFALVPYAPAAMAANATHVERRIEMILNSPSSLRRNRMTMLLGAAALCGWTGFVMSGASAAMPSGAAEDANKPAKSTNWAAKYGALNFFLPNVADSLDDEEDFIEVEGMPLDILPLNLSTAAHVVRYEPQILTLAGDGAASGQWVDGNAPRMMFVRALGSQLAPNGGVDADGNGTVSPEEHEAYLLALAMRDPAAVLGKYPKADTNADGSLSAEEAASLIQMETVPGMPVSIELKAAPGTDDWNHAFTFTTSGVALNPQIAGDVVVDCEGNADGHVQVETHVIRADGTPLGHGSGEPTAIFVKAIENTLTNADGTQPRVMVMRAGDPTQVTTAHSITLTNDAAPADGSRKTKTITVTNSNGVIRTETTEQVGDGEPKVTVTETPATDGDVTITQSADGVPVLSKLPLLSQLFTDKVTASAQAGVPMPPFAGVGGHPIQFEEPAAAWLLSNAAKADKPVTAEEVRKFTATASDAALKRFLRQHPKSDTNKDGTLTVIERDAYQAKMQTRRQKKMLERFPQADKDKNGSLTDDEIREFFKTKTAENTAQSGTTEETVTTEGGTTLRVTKTVTNSEDGKVEVRVNATPEAKDGPR